MIAVQISSTAGSKLNQPSQLVAFFSQIDFHAGSSKERTKLRHRQSNLKYEVAQIMKKKEIKTSFEDFKKGIFPAENHGGKRVLVSIIYRHQITISLLLLYFSLADFHTKYQLVDMWVLNFRAEEEVIQIKREMLNYILSLEEKKDSLQNYVVEDKITNVFLSLTLPLLEIQQVKKVIESSIYDFQKIIL